jgi:hypothetical protein
MTSRYVQERELDELLGDLDAALTQLQHRWETNRDAYIELGDCEIFAALAVAAAYLEALREERAAA